MITILVALLIALLVSSLITFGAIADDLAKFTTTISKRTLYLLWLDLAFLAGFIATAVYQLVK